ncbi:hypothetical protein MMC09_003444 [Bachmanniomyces sp. S44760]|nr:hypothetical protein [Bachmanniomyces sp. S44760]
MPSNRRVKVMSVLLLFVVFTILYFTTNARRSNQEFYDRTVAAMDEKAAAEKQKITTDQDLSRKLKDAEDAARQVATDSATPNNKQPEVVLGGSEDRADDQSSTRGPRTRGGEKWDVSSGKDSPVAETEGEKEKTEEEKDVDLELNTILKRSPIIIFSKSYCPFSKKAKAILVEKYTIVPSPFVVELDKHPMGRKLQDSLQKSTGRGTVPNVLINGRSIGGGDDVEKLDRDGELTDLISRMGGKRIMEVKIS